MATIHSNVALWIVCFVTDFLLEKPLTQAHVTRQDILQEVREVCPGREDQRMSHRCVIDLVGTKGSAW